MKTFLEELKSTKKEIFQRSYHEMLGAYKGELEITKAYNGRQILELLQNCDDEGSKKVLIQLDKENEIISISNLGSSFSEEGYRSLSISNLSSKTSKRKYIGNKGLGFRSIINWSKEIKIISNNICLTFSNEIIEAEFNSLFDEETRAKILLERNFAENIIPLPFLALPKIDDYSNTTDYKTTISINYKPQFFDDIIKQIRSISPETLLFLHNIDAIIFEGFEDIHNLRRHKTQLNITDDSAPKEEVTINDKTWFIFEEENELDSQYSDSENNEKEFYQLKLAIQENISDDINLLFSYFQTNVIIHLPYIIHGTFDLDPSRNQLNNSEKNKFIINRLVKLIIRTSKYLSKDKVNWNPLLLLAYKSDTNKTLKDLGFYAEIDKAIENEAIFPCIDNTYRKLSEVNYLEDEFTNLIIKNNGVQFFKQMVIPFGNTYLHNIKGKIPKITAETKIEKQIDGVSEQITDINDRAEFIFYINKKFSNQKFNFLVDSNVELIGKNVDVFTPSNKLLSIPPFASIKFIHSELYSKLIEVFSLTSSKEKSRELQRLLKQNTKLHSFEPVPLAEKIISSTNEAIRDNPAQTQFFVSEMVKALFINYKQQKENTRLEPLPNIPLLNKNGDKEFSKNLYLSEFYESGKITVALFNDIYEQHEFLASPDQFGFVEEDNRIEIERFFLWLGVTKFVKYEVEYTKDFSKIRDYILYLTKKVNFNYPNQIEVTIIKVAKLKDIISRLNIEKIITWIFFDNEAKRQLDNNNNKDKINHCINAWRELSIKPSFIKFDLNSNGYDFENHLIDEKYDWVNSKQINYSDDLFIKYNISKRDIDNILTSLGATDDFSNLSIERITEILEQLAIKYPDGRNSQTLYRKALKNSQKAPHLKREISLFAHDGESLKLYKPADIFFSDTIKIPAKLKKKYPIFNFPLRSGGREAIDFFQINDLKRLKVNVNHFNQNESITSSFKELFEQLKPYILAYRIEKIEKESIRKQELYKLNSINFILCNQIVCDINEALFEIEKYEFITDDNSTYYIKVNNSDSLLNLQNNPIFTSSFSEILANVFDVVGDKNEFRSLIKDNINETDYYAREQLGSGLLTEARELLGLSDYTISFWQAVFSAIGKPFYYKEYSDKFMENIKYELKSSLELENINYEKLNESDNIGIIKALFEYLNISINDFNKYAVYKLYLDDIHKYELRSFFYNKEQSVKVAIWYLLNEKPITEQSQFLTLINNFNHFDIYITEISQAHKEKFEVEKDNIFRGFIQQKFGNLNFDNTNIDLTSILQENESEFSINEMDKINRNTILKSLLYFSKNICYIREEINNSDSNTPFSADKEVKKSSKDYEIVPFNNYKTNLLPISNGVHKNNGSVYTSNAPSNSDLKRIGDNSEKIVYDCLVEKFNKQFVIWKSKENDGLHYDIKYSPDEGKSWRYVEVKTFSSRTFYLTNDEKEFGEQNSLNYEIWLVCPDGIIKVINNLFSSKDYILNPKDYIVYLTEFSEAN